ncbi:MAG: hypothetical protein VB049_12290 [Candidatus Pelethousia sp.]|nr:hypothetical protein [Candidatus Pelethousia sp.]
MKRTTAILCLFFLVFSLFGCHAKPLEAGTETPAEPAFTPEASPPAPLPSPTTFSYEDYFDAKDAAVTYLGNALEAERSCVYVYRDFGVTENHFTQKAKMFGSQGELVHNMDENWQAQPYAGTSCIRCTQTTKRNDWGGWLFLNGYLPAGETMPRLNDGETDGQGLDLTGASALRFFAKGEAGAETVEFFTAGFGYDGERGHTLVSYPDSAKKQTLGFITLTPDWREYTIPLDGVDLHTIACGFGYVLSGSKSGNGDTVFYLDEIRFTGEIVAAQEAPILLRSYETNHIYIQNAAFSYDNALVAMAFLSEGMQEQAARILDAFVYAVAHDRQGVARIRNAYAAGDIRAFPGWESGARLPGWYDRSAGDPGVWYEDRYQVGSNVGNTAYVALALLQYDSAYEDDEYLRAARALMDWVLYTCTDGTDGFTAGFDGWAEGDPPVVYPFAYKSIEHNIDAYAAFAQLYARTGEAVYNEAAQSALRFIHSMYDPAAGVFYTGTTEDGITPSKDNIVLDAQVWAALALGKDFTPYEEALSRVAAMELDGGGYPFCAANANGGWWAEGTAYTALLYRLRGEDAKAIRPLDALLGIQHANGSFPAATVDALSTGFQLFNGSPWEYATDAHIAPTAWFILAINGFNPYVF